MKIIGIMGNGGSGKTTFSNALSTKDSVGIIHVDDLVGDVKKKYFKAFLQSKEKNTTESTENNPKLKSGAKAFFYKNKLLFNFLMRVRSKLVTPEIEKRVSNFKEEGKSLVIIDDWVLSTHKKLMKDLNHVYVLDRKYFARRQGLQQRDNLSKQELKVSDLPYALGFIRVPNNEKVTSISNNGSLEELQSKALEVYSQYVSPSFDERYKINEGEVTLANVPTVMSNIKSYSDKIVNRDLN